MIVDDDQSMVVFIAKILQDIGFNIVVANDGFEAIKMLNNTVPHIILLDVKMPNMDGYKMLKWLRSHPSFTEVVVIMMTSLNKKTDVITFLQLGADDYIVKPAPIVTLQEKIDMHIRKQKQRILQSIQINKKHPEFEQACSTKINAPFQVESIGEQGVGIKSRIRFKEGVSIVLNCDFEKLSPSFPTCTVQECSQIVDSPVDFTTILSFEDPPMTDFATRYLDKVLRPKKSSKSKTKDKLSKPKPQSQPKPEIKPQARANPQNLNKDKGGKK